MEPDVRVLLTEGKLRSVEGFLLRKEVSIPGSRQKPNMAKLVEYLDQSTLVPIHEYGTACYILNPSFLEKRISKCGASGKELKAMRSSLKRKSGLPELVSLLKSRVGNILQLIGDGRNFHYIEEPDRLFHLLGLSRAIFTAMDSLKIKVRFPNPTRSTDDPTKPVVKNGSLYADDISLGVGTVDNYIVDKYMRNFQREFYQLMDESPVRAQEWLVQQYKIGRSSYECPIDPTTRKEGQLVNAAQVVNRPKSKDAWYRLAVHYLHKFPKGKPEKHYVKLIKHSLCHRFSLEADQDVPVFKEDGISIPPLPLFPKLTDKALFKRFKKSRRERIRFFKHLLECKSLCHPVGSDFIAESLAQHQASLCRPESEIIRVPERHLTNLYNYGVKVGKAIASYYDPFTTRAPNFRATVEKSRAYGGSNAALAGRRRVLKGSIYDSLHGDESSNRPEPIVIGLFGPPGSGKSKLIRRIVNGIRTTLYPSLDEGSCVYSRSCSTDHWDGYCQQPITILDDFGQNIVSRHDLVEFTQLISCNRYIVPMAELENKGMEFKSPIVVVTSNVPFGSVLKDNSSASVLQSDIALWRRFHLPLLVEDGRIYQYRTDRLFTGKDPGICHLYYSDDGHVSATNPAKGLGFPMDLSSKVPQGDEPIPHVYWKVDTRDDKTKDFEIHTLLESEGRNPRMFSGKINRPRKGISAKSRSITGHFDSIDYVRSWKLSRCISKKEAIELLTNLYTSRISHHRQTMTGFWEQKIQEGHVKVTKTDPPFFDVLIEDEGKNCLRNDYYCNSMIFDSLPPYGHLPTADAVAVPEALKNRVITKAEGQVKCLKPLQMALFRYLSEQPQFVLTHGVTKNVQPEEEFSEKRAWIHRIENEIKKIKMRGQENYWWLSGDYTAATDNFPMEVTHQLIKGILSQIDHEPTREWARYECGPHRIRYRSRVGSSIGIQTSGQLMGSLLSFPLLCFLNDYIVSDSGFQQGSYLINGDDVVAYGNMSSINRWRGQSHEVGLALSLGKNYIDREFCCINSQLFYNGRVQHTGKASTFVRRDSSLGACFQEIQFYYGTSVELRSSFIRNNIHRLRETPQNLMIPVSHGGLGLYFNPHGDLSPSCWKLAKEVYLTKFLRKVASSDEVSGFDFLRMISVPRGFGNPEDNEDAGQSSSEREVNFIQGMALSRTIEGNSSPDMSHDMVRKTRNILSDHEALWNKIQGRSMLHFPPLAEMRTQPVFVEKGKVGWVKRKIIQYCIEMLLIEIDRKRLNISTPSSSPDKLWLTLCEEIGAEVYDSLEEAQEASALSELHDLSDSVSDEYQSVLKSGQLPSIEEEDGYEAIKLNNLGPDGHYYMAPSLKGASANPYFMDPSSKLLWTSFDRRSELYNCWDQEDGEDGIYAQRVVNSLMGRIGETGSTNPSMDS